MLHPQPLVLLLTTLGALRSRAVAGDGALGVVAGWRWASTLGAAQLVRSVGLWIYLALPC